MKLWLVGTCVLFLSLPAALGLKCYYCSSNTSWDNCKETSLECTPGTDTCAKVYVAVGSFKLFSKYCITKTFCSQDSNPNCKGKVGPYECEIHCCDSDNCNAGSTSRISGTLLLTCALASLMILVKA